MTKMMKVAAYYKPDNIKYIDFPIPQINDNEVLIELKYVGICGSDILKFTKQLVKDGTVLGHEVCGKIIKVGKNIKKVKVKDRVVVGHHTPCYTCHYCNNNSFSMCKTFKNTNLYPGGFAQFIKISQELVNNTLFKLPTNLSYKEAIFTEPLACCIRAVNRASLHFWGKNVIDKKIANLNNTVLVIGLGIAGLLFIQLYKLLNCNVIGIDLVKERVELGNKLGGICTNNFSDLKNLINSNSEFGVDTVVLSAGDETTVNLVLELVRDGGNILIFSSGKNDTINLNYNSLYFREISLISSYSSTPYDLKTALLLLQKQKINVKPFIKTVLPLKECLKGLKMAMNKEVLKVILYN